MTMTMEQIKEAREIATWKPVVPKTTLKPLDWTVSGNELRPAYLSEVVGQVKLKALLARLIENVRTTGRTLDHMLMLGPSGCGKTTVATVLAHELGRPCYVLKAPVSMETLEGLAKVAHEGDIIFVDELHQQMEPNRRGTSQSADPENFYACLEDNHLTTSHGVIPFPRVCWIGATTDAGQLLEPFLMRFPLQPHLAPYSTEEMATLATANAKSLNLTIDPEAAQMFARASRGVPRITNRYIRNSRSLAATHIDPALAREVIVDLNATTLDALDSDMQNMLRFLLKSRREDKAGNVAYQASVGSIATALGKSRDVKSIYLYTEPYLIRRGFVAIGHGGRYLSAAGIARARAL
jgi:holliday junction DNA helicase RuvB